MAPSNLLSAIAKNINFPDNVEWYEEYKKTILNIVGIYSKASSSERDTFKDDLQSFLEVHDISVGSDDDLDYIQPYYCYIENEDLIKAVGKTPGANLSPIRRIIIKEILNLKTGNKHSLTDLEVFEDIDSAWNDVSTAAIGSGIKKAYAASKINKQWKEIIDGLKPKAITWEALDFAVDVLGNMR